MSLYLKNYSILKDDTISYNVKRSIVAFFLENVALDVATYVTMFDNKTYHCVTHCTFALNKSTYIISGCFHRNKYPLKNVKWFIKSLPQPNVTSSLIALCNPTHLSHTERLRKPKSSNLTHKFIIYLK